jgi:ribosome-binding protein aMBF1 (putative translation factor)
MLFLRESSGPNRTQSLPYDPHSTYKFEVITPAQIRAARALLGWLQRDLAAVSGVSGVAIKDLERGATDPCSSTLNKIERAFNEAGVIFLDEGDTR